MTGPVTYKSVLDLPGQLPLFPLSGALLLPHARLPLNVFEPRYLAMVDDVLAGDRLIALIQPRTSEGDSALPKLFGIGCAGRLTQFDEIPDGRYHIGLTGVCRFSFVGDAKAETPYPQAHVSWEGFESDLVEHVEEVAIDREGLIKSLDKYFSKLGQRADWQSLEGAPPEVLVNSLASICDFGVEEKQALLEAPSLRDRTEILTGLVKMAIAEDADPKGRTLQ